MLHHLLPKIVSFSNLTFSDTGIEPLLGKKAVETFNNIISKPYVDVLKTAHKEKIRELCLRVLGNMSINHAGKQECIDNQVILSAWRYLDAAAA
jgi:hypothetical protein